MFECFLFVYLLVTVVVLFCFRIELGRFYFAKL